MRTPNCKCLVCEKPLYRRPFKLAKVRHVACMEHRGQAQSISGLTELQKAGLRLGRVKGTNHRKGYKHKEESKAKASASHIKFCAENPEKVKARGEKTRGKVKASGGKTRGEKHYNWKGGASKLSLSIRRMTECSRWANAVKLRDQKCVKCGTQENLEADHVVEFASLLKQHGIKNRDDARQCSDLWDVNNGQTLCKICHYKRHDRVPPHPRHISLAAVRSCETCGNKIRVRPSQVKKGRGRFCSKVCAAIARRTKPKLEGRQDSVFLPVL